MGCFLDLDFDEDEGSIGSTARAREREIWESKCSADNMQLINLFSLVINLDVL